MRNIEIGQRIRALREAKKLSKSDLARACKVTPTAVVNWEQNGITPRFEAMTTLAEVLETSAEYLRTGHGNGEAQPSTKASRTVAAIIEAARTEIANVTGMPIRNVHVNVGFVSS